MKRKDTKMKVYSKGEKYPEFKTKINTCRFDFMDDGAILIITFANPRRNEIDNFRSGESFKIKFVEVNELIMICVKIGNLEWMDMPYNIKFSPNLTDYTNIKNPSNLAENIGLGLQIFFADSLTGELKAMRYIGLGHNFSVNLLKTMNKQLESDSITIGEYDMRHMQINQRYSILQLVSMAPEEQSYSI